MSKKRYDATPKGLIEIRPADWPAFLGVTASSVEIADADVSTVTAAADKVLIVRADEGDRVQHLDFQSGPDASVPRRTHGYNALLEERHRLPVDSVVLLLRPEANLKSINGLYIRRLPGANKPYLVFRYRVIRVWELPVETVLSAGISVLPLAPISAVAQNEVSAVIERMKTRLDVESDQATVAELWTATNVLLGLRYEAAFVDQLLQGVRAMKDSTTYQAIKEEGREEGLKEGLKEGRLEEAREEIRRLGQRKFRTPLPAHIQSALDGISDLDRLHQLLEEILDAASWNDLLKTPSTPATPKRKKKP